MTPYQLVKHQIIINVSSLVAQIAAMAHVSPGKELVHKARELIKPVDDYEQAAIQIGWYSADGKLFRDVADEETMPHEATNWQNACELCHIQPYRAEVYEWLAVTEWLAGQLIMNGERVELDFAGLCVWARTNTGQAIDVDDVIVKICANHNATVDALINVVAK